MLILKPLSRRSKSVDCAKQKNPICYFHSAYRFATRTLAYRVRLLGPCFKTGRKKPFSHRHRTPMERLISTRKAALKESYWTLTVHYAAVENARIPRIETRASMQEETPQRIRNHRRSSRTPNIRWRQIWETPQTTRLRSTALTVTFTFVQQQSHTKKLVSFASLSAISRTFNSLSKVLFTFPSRYLFAIGLGSIFSFRRKLPPILRTTSKVRDSTKSVRMSKLSTWTGFSPSMMPSSKKTYAGDPH